MLVYYIKIAYNRTMKVSLRIVGLLITLILIGSLGLQPILAQNTAVEKYFSQYGHYVRGAFLEKYYNVPNPGELFGEPISVAFVSPSNGRLVQYFEKVRFETTTDQEVEISNLGELLRGKAQTDNAADNTAACQYFPQTGFQVCQAFLEFFNANGGIRQFGYPIANLERRSGGQLVQYFQKALLELRPALPAGKRVTVAELGRMAFYQIGEDPTMMAAEQGDNTLAHILALKVHAYPKNAAMPQSGNQTIYVIIQDQRLLPVSNATVELEVLLPSGEPKRIIIPGLSGKNGILQSTFTYNTQSLGIATVQVVVRLGEKLIGRTSTSFHIWW